MSESVNKSKMDIYEERLGVGNEYECAPHLHKVY